MTDVSGIYIPPDQEDGNRHSAANILRFAPEEECAAMVRPPDETTVRLATNQLIAALWNYRQITTGESDDLVSYGEVPEVWRELFYRNYALPAAVQAIWHDEE